MNLYETTFIINPQTDDATVDRHVREVADVITNNQGKIRYEDHMGTRRLAYEIQGLTQGYYASFIFEAPTALLPKLQRHFKLNESYIRHLTVRFEGNLEKLVRPAEDAAQQQEKKPAAAPAKAEVEASEVVEEEVETTESPETAEIETVEDEADTARVQIIDESDVRKSGDATADEQEL